MNSVMREKSANAGQKERICRRAGKNLDARDRAASQMLASTSARLLRPGGARAAAAMSGVSCGTAKRSGAGARLSVRARISQRPPKTSDNAIVSNQEVALTAPGFGLARVARGSM
jgi:hypothetical protein